MNTPEISPNTSEATNGPAEFTTVDYAVLLKKVAEHLAYIANHRLVTDPLLISEKVQHVRDVSVEDLAKELESDNSKPASTRYYEL